MKQLKVDTILHLYIRCRRRSTAVLPGAGQAIPHSGMNSAGVHVKKLLKKLNAPFSASCYMAGTAGGASVPGGMSPPGEVNASPPP